MLTPDAIQSKEFEQSVLGGYRRDEVDVFLDELESDYRKLYVENAELVDKLKACLAKIEEYKKDEEFLKTAIINAQKLNDTTLKEIELKEKEVEMTSKAKAAEIIGEAEEKARVIVETAENEASDLIRIAQEKCRDEIAEAQEKANNEISRIQAETNVEMAKLENLRTQVAEFKNTIIELYKAHLTSISKLPDFKETKADEPKPEVPAPVEEKVEPTPVEEKEEKPVSEEAVADNGNDENGNTVEFTLAEKEPKKAAPAEPKLNKPEKFKFGIGYDINNDD
ncbi:MAG: DivIVA domain-containing protein [Clostridia bacterium]|nr:DivIVA domain-containing protein [Clostridia bacterium]